MARNIDVFGFDELEKAMKQCEKNYPSQGRRIPYGRRTCRK